MSPQLDKVHEPHAWHTPAIRSHLNTRRGVVTLELSRVASAGLRKGGPTLRQDLDHQEPRWPPGNYVQ